MYVNTTCNVNNKTRKKNKDYAVTITDKFISRKKRNNRKTGHLWIFISLFFVFFFFLIKIHFKMSIDTNTEIHTHTRKKEKTENGKIWHSNGKIREHIIYNKTAHIHIQLQNKKKKKKKKQKKKREKNGKFKGNKITCVCVHRFLKNKIQPHAKKR